MFFSCVAHVGPVWPRGLRAICREQTNLDEGVFVHNTRRRGGREIGKSHETKVDNSEGIATQSFIKIYEYSIFSITNFTYWRSKWKSSTIKIMDWCSQMLFYLFCNRHYCKCTQNCQAALHLRWLLRCYNCSEIHAYSDSSVLFKGMK